MAITAKMVTIATMAMVIMTVMKALGVIMDMVTQDYYGHRSHNAYGVIKVRRAIAVTMTKTATIVMMTTISTTAMAASRSCWLYKILGDCAPKSWSLKVMHLYLNV